MRIEENGRHLWWPPLLALAVAFGIAACGGILDVEDPDIVTPEDLNTEAGLATLRAGAIGDLALALDGNASGHGATPGLIMFGGILSDEFLYSGTFPTRREVDQRSIQTRNVSTGNVYTNLHRARAAAERAADKVQEFSDPSQDARFAELKSLEGLTFVMFGEHFCAGVPFSSAPESGDLVFGEPQTTAQMFEAALERFDAALASGGGSATMESLARVLKGRALLNLGRFAEAATAVASVPTDFVYELEHSNNSLSQQNGIYTLSTVRRQWSIADGKGGNGLPYRSANDPRVPWNRTEGTRGQDDQTPYFNQLKYPSSDSNVPIVTGIEARLIEAEAALQANGPAGLFETIHNDLRARVGLPPVATAGMTQTEAEEFHFRERAFWLYATGHRVGDLRRLVRQYGRSTESVFPTGAYFKGGSYGTDVNVPIPVEEENNPNFDGCLDRGA